MIYGCAQVDKTHDINSAYKIELQKVKEKKVWKLYLICTVLYVPCKRPCEKPQSLVTNAVYYSHLTAFLEFWSLIHLPWDYLLMFRTLPSFQQMA